MMFSGIKSKIDQFNHKSSKTQAEALKNRFVVHQDFSHECKRAMIAQEIQGSHQPGISHAQRVELSTGTILPTTIKTLALLTLEQQKEVFHCTKTYLENQQVVCLEEAQSICGVGYGNEIILFFLIIGAHSNGNRYATSVLSGIKHTRGTYAIETILNAGHKLDCSTLIFLLNVYKDNIGVADLDKSYKEFNRASVISTEKQAALKARHDDIFPL